MLELSGENFKKEVLESELPVLVLFWRPGCPACRPLFPIIGEVEEDVEGRAKVGELNVLQNPEIAKEYKVPAVPTMVIFKNGEAKEKAVGLRSKEAIIGRIDLIS